MRDRVALKYRSEKKRERVADHPCHSSLHLEHEAWTGKDSEVEEEDGEFGDVLE